MPIYNGNQKVGLSGISKAYLGDTLVYQNKPQPQWNTIFEGTLKVTGSTSLTGIVRESSDYRFRIWYSCSSSGNGANGTEASARKHYSTVTLYNNTSRYTNSSGSVTRTGDEFNVGYSTGNRLIIEVNGKTETSLSYPRTSYVYFYFNGGERRFLGSVYSSSNTSAQLTITKIEQYY